MKKIHTLTNLTLHLLFLFQLDGGILALQTDLNSTRATLLSSIASLKVTVAEVNQTLQDQVDYKYW